MIKRNITEKSKRVQKKVPLRYVGHFKGSGWAVYKSLGNGFVLMERFVG